MLVFINSVTDFIFGAATMLLLIFAAAVFSAMCLSKKNFEKESEEEKEQDEKDCEGDESERVIVMQYPELGITDFVEVK